MAKANIEMTVHILSDSVIASAFEMWLDDFEKGKCLPLTKKEIKKLGGKASMSKRYRFWFLKYVKKIIAADAKRRRVNP